MSEIFPAATAVLTYISTSNFLDEHLLETAPLGPDNPRANSTYFRKLNRNAKANLMKKATDSIRGTETEREEHSK